MKVEADLERRYQDWPWSCSLVGRFAQEHEIAGEPKNVPEPGSVMVSEN